MTTFYGKDGRAVTMSEWKRQFHDRRMALTTVDRYRVSTVYLGVDHSGGVGPPLIFESMVFENGSRFECYLARYATEGDAWEGHTSIVATLRTLGLGGLSEKAGKRVV